MTSLSRPHVPTSANLLGRILERPGLIDAVRQLPGATLGALIERVGLEDAGELVALASREQLERIFDDDLWRATRAGGDEMFRPERFALWIRVMLEAGDEAVVRRLCELPPDLVALGVQRLVLVLDDDVIEEQLTPGDEQSEQLARALEDSVVEEWEELRLIARDADAWEDVWNALRLLERDHHDQLRSILERCCDITMEFISGQGSLFHVLTADQMLESDVAAVREDRRAAEGFVSPADARAFLALAPGEAPTTRDPITRAYFRELAAAARPPGVSSKAQRAAAATPAAHAAASRDAHALEALLREAEVIAPEVTTPLLLAASAEGACEAERAHVAAPLFEEAMRELRRQDPATFSARMVEIGYLVNVWMAGGAHDERRPRPVEALHVVLRTCEAGLVRFDDEPSTDRAVAVLAKTSADLLFRRGFAFSPEGQPSARLKGA